MNAFHHLVAQEVQFPAYLKRLQYIKADTGNTLAVDTGILATNCTFRGRFRQLSYHNDMALFGCFTPGVLAFHLTYYQYKFYFGFGTNAEYNVSIPGGSFDAQWHDYELSYGGSFKIDGQTLFTFSDTGLQLITSSCVVFGRNAGYYASNIAQDTLCSSFSIVDNLTGSTICDLAPVIDLRDGMAHMFDKITKRLAKESGTGSFVPGPEFSL